MNIVSLKPPTRSALTKNVPPAKVIPGSKGKVVDPTKVQDRFESLSTAASVAGTVTGVASALAGASSVIGALTGGVSVNLALGLSAGAVAGGLVSLGLFKAAEVSSDRVDFWRSASRSDTVIKSDIGVVSVARDGWLRNHTLGTGLAVKEPENQLGHRPISEFGVGRRFAVASVQPELLLVEGMVHSAESPEHDYSYAMVHTQPHDQGTLRYSEEEKAFLFDHGEQTFQLSEDFGSGNPEIVEVSKSR